VRQDASYFEGKDAVLVYIAKRLRDALRLESVLTAAGLEYGVETDHYYGGTIFRRERVGAFFYVVSDSVKAAHRAMQDAGYHPHEGY
jgi:hypothetical protein